MPIAAPRIIKFHTGRSSDIYSCPVASVPTDVLQYWKSLYLDKQFRMNMNCKNKGRDPPIKNQLGAQEFAKRLLNLFGVRITTTARFSQ
ncbi:unnamed protein product [Ilex paraguariensis]|uniref:LAGLIDADG homing endonuclease n=1 Tax=Ilex paraguariensis TaxID=185542 RepID=A0ABC8REG2_9AQUA